MWWVIQVNLMNKVRPTTEIVGGPFSNEEAALNTMASLSSTYRGAQFVVVKATHEGIYYEKPYQMRKL